MSSDNRLYWFEWAFGIGGAILFAALGVAAIHHRSITLGGRFGANSFDGAVAIAVGWTLVVVAWGFFSLLLRTTRLRRAWSILGLFLALVLCAILTWTSSP